jgi:hypothetical protein
MAMTSPGRDLGRRLERRVEAFFDGRDEGERGDIA